MNPTPLPKSFKKGPWCFKTIRQSGPVRLLLKTNKTYPAPNHYEVVVTRTLPPKTWPNGQTSPARETMPPCEAWGRSAFTFTPASHLNPLQTAQAKFDQLVKATAK